MSIIEDYKVLVKNGTEKILSNGGEWNKWLKFAGNTYTYDVNNSIAIYMQNPKVTAAAELTEWNDYNRRVHKGQKGIMIYKDGRIRYIFDISQTYYTGGKKYGRWSISETHKFINFINQKYDIDNKNFDEYLASMIAYLAHDKNNSDILFQSVRCMVSERAGVTYTDNNLSDMFNALMKYERKYILTETHNISAKILHKIERENKQYKIWRNENEQGTINTGSKRTQRKVKQELPTKAFLTEKQINRRLSVGSYGRRLMEWMKEQQQERYQQLLQEGDLFPILVEVQVEASQTKDKMVDEMLNDPEIKAMDWLERSKVITLQSDLIDQQIMREIVLIPR